MEDQNEELVDPKHLRARFQSQLEALTPKAIKKKSKGTNIPKFLIKVFFKNIPEFPD